MRVHIACIINLNFIKGPNTLQFFHMIYFVYSPLFEKFLFVFNLTIYFDYKMRIILNFFSYFNIYILYIRRKVFIGWYRLYFDT